MTSKSVEVFKNLDTDTYIGEIKWENTIARLTGSANPRQIERVPAGAEFEFKLVYNIEDEEQIDEDMKILAQGFQLLQMDYLGGHGSRGYGRVKFSDFKVKAINKKIDADEYEYFLKGNVHNEYRAYFLEFLTPVHFADNNFGGDLEKASFYCSADTYFSAICSEANLISKEILQSIMENLSREN